VEISGDRFSEIDYSDDIAMQDVDPVNPAATLKSMKSVCCDFGPHISWIKTKMHNIGAGQPAQTIIVGAPAAGVENFSYLGSQLSSVDGSRTEQRRRMGIAASTDSACHTSGVSHTSPSPLGYVCTFPCCTGTPICLRDMDYHQLGLRTIADLPHEVSE